MNTIILNKQNFSEGIKKLEKKLGKYDLEISLKSKKEPKELIWTKNEQKAYDEAMKDLENGQTIDGEIFLKKLLGENV